MTDIAIIPKNAREELRISLDEFNGHELLNLRIWFHTGDGEMRPTKKGVALKVALLPELLAALVEAEKVALFPKGEAA